MKPNRACPNLPSAKKLRLADTYKVSVYQAGVLASDAALADYFERAAKLHPQHGPAVANLLLNDFLATATGENPLPSIEPHYFGELAELSATGARSTASNRRKSSRRCSSPARRRPRW